MLPERPVIERNLGYTLAAIGPLGLILLLFAAFYTLAYLASPYLPGQNIKHPEGWWGWTDQGLYFKSAAAFARYILNGSEHHYPFLYPLLAAPFVDLMGTHAFFVVDIICFLIAAGGFLIIGSRLIGLFASAVLFTAVLWFPWEIGESWIIPWTSTPSAALTTVLLLICSNERFVQGENPVRHYLFYGMLASLLVAIRPLDFAPAALTYVYIGIRTIHSAHRRGDAVISWKHVRLAAALALGTAFGPCLYMAFSLRAYGSLIAPYIIISRDSGYLLPTIPQKFVSLFVDSDALYQVSEQTFLAYFPWLLVTIAMIPIVLFSAPNILRLICVLACTHFALYFAYSDLGPYNVFLFKVTHYFKVWMPYLALVAAFGLVEAVRVRRLIVSRAVVAMGVAIAFLVTCLGFDFLERPISATVVGERTITIEPSGGETATLDLIDLPGLGSPHLIKYEIGNNAIIVDGNKLRRLADVHLGHSPAGMRIFFMRPTTFKTILITLDETFVFPKPVRVVGFTYDFTLKRPYWLRSAR